MKKLLFCTLVFALSLPAAAQEATSLSSIFAQLFNGESINTSEHKYSYGMMGVDGDLARIYHPYNNATYRFVATLGEQPKNVKPILFVFTYDVDKHLIQVGPRNIDPNIEFSEVTRIEKFSKFDMQFYPTIDKSYEGKSIYVCAWNYIDNLKDFHILYTEEPK